MNKTKQKLTKNKVCFYPINNKLGGDKEYGITTWLELKSLTDSFQQLGGINILFWSHWLDLLRLSLVFMFWSP